MRQALRSCFQARRVQFSVGTSKLAPSAETSYGIFLAASRLPSTAHPAASTRNRELRSCRHPTGPQTTTGSNQQPPSHRPTEPSAAGSSRAEIPESARGLIQEATLLGIAKRPFSKLHTRYLLVGLHDFVPHLHHQLKRRSAFSTAIIALCRSAPLPLSNCATWVAASPCAPSA